MQSAATVKALEELYVELGVLVEAAEQYPRVYKKAKRQYAQLLRIEQQFDLAMRHYFVGLPARLINKISWSEYQATVNAWDVEVDIDQQDWTAEEALLLSSSYPYMAAATRTGATAAGELFTTTGSGTPVTEAAIQQQAAAHAAELVKGMNDTTKAEIRRSIQTSLREHETYDQAATRLGDILDSAYRAERVARTETVRAYNAGIVDWGVANGAASKTWQVSANPCPICEAMSDTTVGIDSTFLSGDAFPPAHPNCRCGLVINMASDDVPVDFEG